MKWPWARQPEPAEQTATALAPPIDVEALVRQAAASAAEQARTDTLADISRVLVSSSPMVGLPNPNDKPAFPLYAWDNPLWFSTAQAPTRRPGSLVTLLTLRQLADTYDVLRACIQHLKREVSAVPIEVVARDSKDKSPATKKAIADMDSWFSTRGGLGGPGKRRQHFESMLIEDLAVIGSAAVYHQPTRGGRIASSVVIDSSTIRPVVDAYGWTGEYPYEQWILGLKVASFTGDEMTYDGLFPKSYSPYYWSPVEWLIFTVNRALRSDAWNEAWLTDGNTPADVYAMPETWNPDQVKSWATYWDAMQAGDSKARQKAKFVPSGTQRVGNPSRKDQDFQEYELWLMRRCCAIMGTQPASIGFAGEQYKVSQGDSMESTSEFGVAGRLDFRKALYDEECERLGYPELEIQNVVAREEKATERSTRNATLVGAGIKTPNEARTEEGLEAVDGGDTLFIQNTLTPLEFALVPPPDPLEMVKATAEAKAANGNPNAPDSGPGDGGGNGDNSAKGAKRAALSQWEAKALKRFRLKRSAVAPFESEAIARSIHAHVEGRLAGCTSTEAVRALFREAATLEPEEAAERTDWADRVAKELEALSEISA